MSNADSSTVLRTPERSDPLYVASVGKAFRVLEAFRHTITDLSLMEISDLTGLDKSTAQRFTHTLCQLGYLQRDDRTRRLRLGKPVLDLSFYYLRSNALIERATPALVELRNICGERANLSLYDDTTTIYVVRQQAKREYFDSSLIGRRVPVFVRQVVVPSSPSFRTPMRRRSSSGRYWSRERSAPSLILR